MSVFERDVARRVRAGEVVEYFSTPLYDDGVLPPSAILLTAHGSRGGTVKWDGYFEANRGTREKAIEILRQVTADFDRAHGTSITPKLERALSRGAGARPPS